MSCLTSALNSSEVSLCDTTYGMCMHVSKGACGFRKYLNNTYPPEPCFYGSWEAGPWRERVAVIMMPSVIDVALETERCAGFRCPPTAFFTRTISRSVSSRHPCVGMANVGSSLLVEPSVLGMPSGRMLQFHIMHDFIESTATYLDVRR